MKHPISLALSALLALGLAACATNQAEDQELTQKLRDLEEENEQLRQQQLVEQNEATPAVAPAPQTHTQTVEAGSELLPPGAREGECYARVWTEPQFQTVTERVLVEPEKVKVKTIPPQYVTTNERVLISEAGTKTVVVPPVYGNVKERILVQEPQRRWQTSLAVGGALASDELLERARSHGIDTTNAKPGDCFHEHYLPGKAKTRTKNVLVKESTPNLQGVAGSYRMVDKQILVKEETYEYKHVPATYEWKNERILVKPAHSVWKKGTGPIQRIDEATGEIMCLVEEPAEYKTIKKRVVVTPARTEKVTVPAVYKTVRVREPLTEETARAEAERNKTAPVYEPVEVFDGYEEGYYVWHEIHNLEHPSTTRTGQKICLVETPAKYKTVTRAKVVKPAETRYVDLPAQYRTEKVRKLVTEAREERHIVPARYEMITRQNLVREGRMEWRSILCETNMTASRVRDIQRSLRDRGYNPGPIDGVVGRNTMRAVNAFQRDNGLPVDRYLNIETIEALGVSTGA